jgi:hypothetical protein
MSSCGITADVVGLHLGDAATVKADLTRMAGESEDDVV